MAEQRRIELKKAAVEIRQMSNEDELAFFLRVRHESDCLKRQK